MAKIIVPATSANMGPGFDCIGIALNMYHEVTIIEYDGETIIETDNPAFNDKNNLIFRAMEECMRRVGYSPKGIHLHCKSQIPASRGLGSSAACIVAGIAGANAITGSKLTEKDILQIASEMEGHPDNVAPALFGGMVVSIMDNDNKSVYYEKVAMKNNYRFCAMIPDFMLSTKESRAVLPASVNFKDSVFNIGRACMMIAAMNNGSTESLRTAFDDRLHQQYRGKLIDKYEEITVAAKEAGSIGVFLSGAGPTIMSVVERDNIAFEKMIRSYFKENCKGWRLEMLEMVEAGMTVEQ